MGAMGGGGGLLSPLPGALDRGALNRGMLNPAAMMHRVEGSASIDINVSAPPGTRVAAQSGGLFKPVALTRQTQMMPTQGGPHLPGGTEFVSPESRRTLRFARSGAILETKTAGQP
jgi:hypothetical protein